MAYNGGVSVLWCTVLVSIIVLALQIDVVTSASRQEQEILLLDALSRKYSQSSPSNQYEANSIMDMLGRSTNQLACRLVNHFPSAFYPNSDGGMIFVFHSDTSDLQVQGKEVRVRPVHLLHFGRRQAHGSLFRWNDLVVLRGRGSAPGLKSQPGSH